VLKLSRLLKKGEEAHSEAKIQLAESYRKIDVVLMQRDSSQFEFDTDEMASWTRFHRCQPNMQDWLDEFVPSTYVIKKH
jgi:hypothetical protein